jgi:predicted O-linked N-acetylglucosamine transferase (SPINDLY family)/GT2 family glycosyltransferase/ubiquinone/menaquinone biosynthesis C-methylase UbiE
MISKNASISVVTSVRNCLAETKEFLDTLVRFKPHLKMEIILIDDGSEEETRNFLRQQPGINLLSNSSSLGFGKSNNMGVSAAMGEWLLFLNNDLVLTQNWFSPFENVIKNSSKWRHLGCLGNVQVDPRTKRVDHSGITFKEGHPTHFGLGSKMMGGDGYSEYLAVTGACFMVRRDIFLQAGGFDEEFKTGFEDIDLCLRLRMLGYRHFVANSSVIYHKRSSTPERNEHQVHNSRVFYGRWSSLITRFQEWERLNQSKELGRSVRKYQSYVTQNSESFLFAEEKLLSDHFLRFLNAKHFLYAEKLLKIFEDNRFDSLKSVVLKVKLLRAQKKYAKARHEIQNFPNGNNQPILLWELAEVEKEAGNYALARKTFSKLIKRKYRVTNCWSKIGEIFLAQANFPKAEHAHGKVILLNPDSFDGWSGLAKAFCEQGKFVQEANALEKAHALNPLNIRVSQKLFEAFLRMGNRGKAYQLLLQSKWEKYPKSLLLKVGQLYMDYGEISRAIECFDKLIENGSLIEEALFLKGNAMVTMKQFKSAVSLYSDALKYRPDWPEAYSNLVNSKAFLCDWQERTNEIEKLQELVAKNKLHGGAFELAGLYHSPEEEADFCTRRAAEVLNGTKKISEKLKLTHETGKKEKKRIGFLSADFRNHAVGHAMIGLLENLCQKKFELFLYSTSGDDGTEITKEFRDISQNFIDLTSLNLRQKAVKINSDGLDLLVDLGGFSRGHNAELLALHPAPRQVHFLGYATSMGKRLVDFAIADRFVIPPSSSQFFGEKIIRMNGCFFPPGKFDGFAKRSKRAEVGLPARGVVYCAFHAAYKLDPDIWACWMRILKAVPESVLWLKFKPADDALKNLKSEAVRSGVSSKRIIMAADLENRKDHLSRMALADLYLDAPLYNGHASAMDALHAKLPILTVKGNRFSNRVGASFCEHLGIKEMIARNLKEYEEKAIELGLKPSLLWPLRKRITENHKHVLCPRQHAVRFEAAVDKILSKPYKEIKKVSRPRVAQSIQSGSSADLSEFTLVMIRPNGVTNWACNVNMLAEELNKHGGKTIVLESQNTKSKRTDFSGFVKRIKYSGNSEAEATNYGLLEVETNYVVFLDDPLRVLPSPHFIEALKKPSLILRSDRIGILGIGSSLEPNTGVLVTHNGDSENAKTSGLFTPCFALNFRALEEVGGMRNFGGSLALSCLDLSLRLESKNYRSVLIEVDKLICPARSGKDFIQEFGKQPLEHFSKFWNRMPVSLKPKYPPKDEQVGETADYQEWVRLCDTITEGDILAFKKEADELTHKPLISVVMPVFDPPKKFLVKAIESVLSQAYENWELCIAEDASTKKYIKPLLESYSRKDPRIKVTFRKTNGHISVASNSAIKLATGQFVAFLDHDDELRSHSLLEVAKVINANPDAKLIYSDEDKIDELGHRYDPYFKPDWNPDLLLGQNYISHFSVFEVALLRKLKGLRKGYEGSQDWDLTLRFTEQIKDNCILHVSKILYHWRAITGSTAFRVKEKSNIFDVTEKAINECLQRKNIKASVSFHEKSWNYPKIKHLVKKEVSPTVSILIATRDRVDLLEKCITSILATIEYKNIEIIIIDNESREELSLTYLNKIKKEKRIKLLSISGKFNYSKLNNLAVGKVKGEILLLLNNDIEAMTKGWFEEMLSHVMRSEIGCVGAKLLYPDDRLQHGGVIVGLGGGAGHSHKFAGKGSRGYNGHLSVVRNVSAVTAACMMIRKEIYENAGGLDEKSFKVAFNDVDFCLRVEKLGYRNLWTPFAELVHHESVSRGDDQSTIEKRIRFSGEILSLQNRWSLKSYDDPHYNRNLTMLSEQYWFGITRKNNLMLVEKKAGGRAIIGKKQKKDIILSTLKPKFTLSWNGLYFDCMPENAKEIHGVEETENISQHQYDDHAIEIIKSIGDGFILDCGSGKRPTYYSNVVNFDPVAYETTDVVGVGENLPFKDGVFDAVFSLNVLEHVRDPFTCAKEIARVLKPSGKLYCVAPLMAPYHGYPNHYYNMTKAGLRNLFEGNLVIQKQDVLDSGHPIYSLTWILNSWVQGLESNAKKAFLRTSVSDLLGDPASYFDEAYVNSLNIEKKFELAATTALWAEKKNSDTACSGDLFLQIRREVYQTLSGKGFEIGAFEHPAELPSSCEVKYFDRISTEQAKDLFPEISHKKLPKVDITGDLDQRGLGQIPSESFDFVIMNHVLEHLFDPIQAIKECLRILKPGGSLVMSVPDKRFTFDFERKLTKWELLLNRYQKDLKKPKLENYEEIYKSHPNLKGKKLSKTEKVSFLKDCMERREHLNVWDSKSFKTFLMKTLKFLRVEVDFEKEVSGDESHFEFLVHLKKIDCAHSDFNINKIKSHIEILSLHVPKTGGTSFGKCLSEIYGKSFIPHYPELEKQGSESLDALIDRKCVHGHLILDRYQEICEGADLVTWLRNPVDRTLSLYHHISSNPDSSNEFHQRVYRQKPSIIEFCEMPENQNQLFYWIADRNPEDFKFIGFLEMAQASIVKCTSALGWPHVPNFPWNNKTSKRNIFKVSPSEREFIKAKNQDEWHWIEKAKEIFG